MEDRDLYHQILGLESPWTVQEVQLDTEREQIDVFVDHASGTKFCCPVCEKSLSIYCLLYTSPSPRDLSTSRMPSSA